jgi:hypothetical protein
VAEAVGGESNQGQGKRMFDKKSTVIVGDAGLFGGRDLQQCEEILGADRLGRA